MREWEYATEVFWIVVVLLAVSTVVLSIIFSRQKPEMPEEPTAEASAEATTQRIVTEEGDENAGTTAEERRETVQG